jgi:RNA polymerase sigma factor (TIGR02999 family)
VPTGDLSVSDVTHILTAIERGDAQATDELLPLVYEELRRLAHRQMAAEPPGQTLQPTALVHEAYLRLVGQEDLHWESRAHFFAAAAQAMRRILVERARRRGALRRGAGKARVSLQHVEATWDDVPPERILALDAALRRLDHLDHRKAQLVMLRFFTGLTIEETARSLGVSPATVTREWQFAKVWLYREMTRDERHGP